MIFFGALFLVIALVAGLSNLLNAHLNGPWWLVHSLAGITIVFAAIGGPLLGSGIGFWLSY